MQRARVNRERAATSEKETKKAVTALEESGGYVESEYKELRPRTWLEKQFDDPGDADNPVGVLKVTGVTFWVDSVTVTDTDLEYLKELPDLEFLNLSSTDVSDAGLKHLKGLTRLHLLGLFGTDVSDAGLEHLKGLTSLESLGLGGTEVSDAGLEHLKGLTNLQYLNLRGTDTTDKGIAKLQQALPNCKIEYQTLPTSAPTRRRVTIRRRRDQVVKEPNASERF